MSEHEKNARQFAAVSTELVALHGRMAELHRRLAERPSLADETALAGLRTERDAKLQTWAMIGLEWLVAGGAIDLKAPAETSDRQVGLRPPHEDSSPTFESIDAMDDEDEDEDEEVDLSIIDSLVLGSNWSHDSFDPGFSIEALHEIILRLGPPRDELSHDELLGEAAILDKELTRISRWGQFPRGIQRALLGLVACRMRRLQDDTPSQVRVVLELQLRRGFARLTQFSSEYQPGWVTGLSRQHKPESDSWLSDAQYWWNALQRELGSLAIEQQKAGLNPEVSLNDLRSILQRAQPDPIQVRKVANRALRAGVAPEDPRLVRMLEPHLGLLSGDKNLKRVRKAIRLSNALDDGDYGSMGSMSGTGPLSSPPMHLDEDAWPYIGRTRDRVAAMVGGEPREQRRISIEKALEFASLEWVGGFDIRAVQTLSERIRSGRVDFVILLGRFINHKVTDIILPACNGSDIDWVMVRQGFGITQIKMAIERYLGDSVGDETM